MKTGLTLAVIFGVLVPSALIAFTAGKAHIVSVIALSAGASAFSLMAINLFLATRPKFIEPFVGGLDRLYVVHKWVGILVLIFAFFHESVGMDLEGQIVSSGLAKTAAELAELVFPVLIALLLISFIKRIPKVRRDLIPYHWWRWTHRILGVVFIVLCVHQLFVKVPFTTNAAAAQYLNLMAVMGILSFVYSQFLAPFRPRKYVVTSVEKHPAATIIDAEPVRGAPKFRPGRFAVISFRAKGLGEPHPFTLSRIGDDGSVQFSIRGLGDYTGRVRDGVKVGDKMTVEGGYGRFNYYKGENKQVWLAGGIGVTPFLAFADSLTADEKREIRMVYCVGKEDEPVGLDRLRAAEERCPGFSLHLHVSSNDGRMDAKKLAGLVPFEIPKAGLWFCGPAPMREAILKGLSKSGQSPSSVHFEEFEFR